MNSFGAMKSPEQIGIIARKASLKNRNMSKRTRILPSEAGDST